MDGHIQRGFQELRKRKLVSRRDGLQKDLGDEGRR